MSSLGLDPAVEELLEAAPGREAVAPPRRELVAELAAGALLVAAVAALAVAFGIDHAGPWWVAPVLVVAYAVVGRARFDVGAGYTCPTELVLVPMAFAVSPALLPVLVAAGSLLRYLPDVVVSRRSHPLRLVMTVPDAWYAVGPALVLGLAGSPAASFGIWPVLLAAFAAQIAVDLLSSVAREWAILGVPPALQARVMGEVAAVDAALAPVGLLAAVAMVAEPAAIACVLPLAGLLAVFARERDERIRQALQLSSAYRGTALLMGDVLKADDVYTGGEHSHGVVFLSMAVAERMGLDGRARRDLEFGSLLHDVGKLHVSNDIINKPGKLTPEEWEVVRRHPVEGQRMLERIGGTMAEVGRIVRAHHERLDGGGYPDGLRGDEIPLAARVICACDAFSAMTTDRAYRPAMPYDAALAELRRCSGQQFDPDVVAALAEVVGELRPPARSPSPLTLA